MTKFRAAEWILWQVFPPDRTASTVGDWMEDAAERGPAWFWCCVFRTVLSRIWADFAGSPGFMLSLALRSCLFSWLVFVIGTIVLYMFYISMLLFPGLPWHQAEAPSRFLIELTGWISATAYGVITGRWAARRANGRRMAGCLACCVASLILSGAICLGSRQLLSGELQHSLATHAAKIPWIIAELSFEAGLIVGFLRPRRPGWSVAQ